MSTWPLRQNLNVGQLAQQRSGYFFGTAALRNDGATNAFGSYVEVVAATPFDSAQLIVQWRNRVAANHILQMEIATGSAGNEVPLVRFACPFNFNIGQRTYPPVTVPLFVPRGTRISARIMQSFGTSTVDFMDLNVLVLPVTPYTPTPFRNVEIVNLDATQAQVLVKLEADRTGIHPDELGGITQVKASIGTHWKAFSVGFGYTSLATNNCPGFDVYLRAGASGNGERVFGPVATEQIINAAQWIVLGPYPCDLPVGTRVLLELFESFQTITADDVYPVLYGWS